MSEKIYYKIEEQELKALVENYLILRALQWGGVDSWEWYDDSIRDLIDNWELEKIDLEPNEKKNMKHLVRDQLLEYEVLEV